MTCTCTPAYVTSAMPNHERCPKSRRCPFQPGFLAYYLASGGVETELLTDAGYRPALMEYGSTLEMAFTIFTKVLETDEAGRHQSRLRAATSGSVDPRLL